MKVEISKNERDTLHGLWLGAISICVSHKQCDKCPFAKVSKDITKPCPTSVLSELVKRYDKIILKKKRGE